ncbi:nuclear protein localization 4 like protein [Babesia gibsoni]|uniref:Nuclear protein localization 4 like protein n=1 Tax=Babesia gibsoni TaxID=33632 RepID=A0AAD8PEA6_BABGI|nr:nuclear protein localization 4 like protein [Babesia gibsoni]
MSGIVIRVISDIGISRITLQAGSTLGDLRREIGKRIQFKDGTLLNFVSTDSNLEIFGQDGDPLEKFGVGHGSCLQLVPVSQDSSHSLDMSYIALDKTRIEAEDPSSSAKDKQNDSSSRSEDKDDANKGPTFKSFDAYLMENGFPIGELPLKQSYKSVMLERGKMNKLPSGVTVKHQTYRHVDHLEIMNVEDMQNFANYWMNDLEMAEQRAGWLYGYYLEDNHYPLGIRAVCEGIYEPPQKSSLCDVELLPDEFLPIADTIAGKFGLERIGHIITHLPRENYLSPQDIVDCAKIQLERAHNTHYTGYPVSTHVTCTMHPDSEGKPGLNVFMASDTAMALVRDGTISHVQKDPMVVTIREPSSKNEVLPQIIESGKEVTSFDPSWLIIRVNDSAPIVPNSMFKYFDFPRENRSGQPVTNNAVKKFLSSRLAGGLEASNPSIFCDFHLLLYLAKILDIETSLAICDAILGKATLDPIMVEFLMNG